MARTKGIGLILLGIGLWYVLGAIFDWLGDKAIERLRKGDKSNEDMDNDEFRESYPRAALMEDAADDIQRWTRKGLPWGIAASLLGAFFLIIDPG